MVVVSATIDTGSIGSSPTLHVLRREPGVRRSVAFRLPDRERGRRGAEVRSVCGRTGPLEHLELGLDPRTVRVKHRVVCVTCLELDRARDLVPSGSTSSVPADNDGGVYV